MWAGGMAQTRKPEAKENGLFIGRTLKSFLYSLSLPGQDLSKPRFLLKCVTQSVVAERSGPLTLLIHLYRQTGPPGSPSTKLSSLTACPCHIHLLWIDVCTKICICEIRNPGG
jgi:hypothetical protein